MGQKFIDFLLAHKPSSHAIALALIGFCTIYTQDKQFSDWVNALLGHWPKLVLWLGTFAAICLRYSSSLKRFAQ